MGSRVIRVMNFLPANFQLAMPFDYGLRVRHGTDRRTDRQRPSTLNVLTLWGRGIIRYTGQVCRQQIKLTIRPLKVPFIANAEIW